MRAKWAALLSSASLLFGSASVSAQGPLTLSPFQLDGVVPAYQYDPSRYQLQVSVEALAVTDPDRAHDRLAMQDPEASVAAQQLVLEEPEVRCTPARRALLASAGNSESAAPEVIARRGLAPGGSVSLTAEAASPAAAWRDQRLAAASPAVVINDSTSPTPTVARRSQPTSIRSVGSSARQIAIDGGQRATVVHLGPNGRQGVSSSRPRSPTGVSAGATGRRAPAMVAAASRPQAVAVPSRTVRSDSASRSAGTSALRLSSGANASDVLARARARVDRTMSGLRGEAFSMRR